MALKDPNAVGVPGVSLSMAITGSQPLTSRVPTTSFTALLDFEAVKDLLSNKPLRRPNRTRPIEPG